MQPQNNKKLEGMLEAARSTHVTTSPFFAARTLAEYRARQKDTFTLRVWKAVALTSLSLCFAFVVSLTMRHETSTPYLAAVAKPYVVKIQMAEFQEYNIVEAEIELPEGVSFYSKSYPELKEKRSLRIAWDAQTEQSVLPFVIQGAASGQKLVKVRFFDSNNQAVSERELNIRFQESRG